MSKRRSTPQNDTAHDEESTHPTSPVQKRPRPASDLCAVPPAPFYDFTELLDQDVELRKHATYGKDGKPKIDFSTHAATLALTKALLARHFDLSLRLPAGHLVPTIPNRVQYLRWAASLFPSDASTERQVLLDVGTGPSAIYAMLAARLYPAWNVIALDNDAGAIASARENVQNNTLDRVTVVYNEKESKVMFPNAVRVASPTLTVCNPPFHGAVPQNARRAGVQPGTDAQLATEGGELSFIQRLAAESAGLPSVAWFTSLVGRKVDLAKIATHLRGATVRASYVRTAELRTGGRTVRWAVAWSFGPREPSVQRVNDAGGAASKWRITLVVRPGRAFANRLAPGDVVDMFAVALTNRGWTGAGERRVFKRDNPGGRSSEVSITASEEAVGEYHICAKVVESGGLGSEELVQLLNDVGSEVERMLRECAVGVE